jgi:hypothetical protein
MGPNTAGMTFSFQWQGQRQGSEEDQRRALAAAARYCDFHEIDPAQSWGENVASLDRYNAMADEWAGIEWAAIQSLAHNLPTVPENVALVWDGTAQPR